MLSFQKSMDTRVSSMAAIEKQNEAPGLVLKEQTGGVLRLTLANPPANALSVRMMTALQEALDEARDDASVRVVVLGSAGKVFSAGHDLKELTAHRADPDGGRAF